MASGFSRAEIQLSLNKDNHFSKEKQSFTGFSFRTHKKFSGRMCETTHPAGKSSTQESALNGLAQHAFLQLLAGIVFGDDNGAFLA